MPTTSPQVDAYIAKAPEFARPILRKLRSLVHQACPDVEETTKWGFPHFEHQGILASMAAFKNHASFGFWKGSLLKDRFKLFEGVGDTSMNALRIASLGELPSDDILLDYLREAIALNEQGVKAPKAAKKPKKALRSPDDLRAALRKNKKAQAAFDAFSPSHQREYIEWITEAKQEATRSKRIATAIEWLAQGKSRHWKYQKR